MECGFSREMFLEWCADTRNTVIVTGRSGDRTLSAKLIRMAEQMADNPNTVNRNLTLEVKRRIRLEGAELDSFRAKKREEERDAARKRLEESRRNARLEQAESSDDSDDDDAMMVVPAAIGALNGDSNPVSAPSRHASTTSLHNGTSALTTPNGTSLTAAQLAEQRVHDIMWRWEQQQKSSFFKQNKKAFPVFPYVEEKTRWDDYGEIIRPEEYTIADTAIVPHVATDRGASETANGTANTDNGAVVPLYEEREWPTKCITQIVKMEVLCNVDFIDFEGRSDGESIKKILSQIKPKQLIIVHGSAAATRHLAQFATETGVVQGKIFTPRLGEIVDATIESHIYQVTLSDALMSSLIFQTVKDAELSWLDARIGRRKALRGETLAVDEGQPAQDADEPMEEGERLSNKKAAEADTFCLEPMPSTNIPSHQAVFVNDPKLSDMKQLLMANGLHAEFSSGVLYINNVASIRRNEAGRFHVEGCASEDYYKIRDLVYAQFAIV